MTLPAADNPNSQPYPNLPYPSGGGMAWLERLAAEYGAEQGGVGDAAAGGVSASGDKSRRQRVTYAIQLDLRKPEEAALAKVFDQLQAARKFKPTLLSVMAAWHRAEGVFG